MGVKRAQKWKNDCWEMAKTWIQLTSKQTYLFPIHLNKIWGFGVLGYYYLFRTQREYAFPSQVDSKASVINS